jgi:hypothetical protein
MRLFLSNKGKVFTSKDVKLRSRVSQDTIRRELNLLNSVEFIKKKAPGYIFNASFKFAREFEGLLISSDAVDKNFIISCFKKSGKLKLFILSGVFIKNKDARVDLLIVGDGLKKGKIEEGIRKIEAEMGVELSYAMFATKEFIYRLNMYDKLVRDIIDFPHEVILESRELSTQSIKKP